MTACGPLCGPITGGAESLSLPPGTGRIWTAVPLFRRNAYSGHLPPPNRFARDEKKSGKTHHISPQCGGLLWPSAATGRGIGFYPPSGGASRAFGLPLAAKRVLRAGARTHFRRPEGRRAERRNRALPGYRLCGLLDFAMPLTKKKPLPLCH